MGNATRAGRPEAGFRPEIGLESCAYGAAQASSDRRGDAGVVRVLVVLASPPLPEGGAPGKHAIALLRGLAGHGVDVHAVAAAQYFQGDVPPELPVELVAVPPDRERSRLAELRRPRGCSPTGRSAAASPSWRRPSTSSTSSRPRRRGADRGTTTPSVVHLHNRVLRDRELGLPPGARFRGVFLVWLSERAAIRRHRFLLASSPQIAADLRSAAPRARVAYAPLSLDPALYEPGDPARRASAGVIGTAGWPPTGAAMTRLLEGVWPRVRALLPDAQLLVAGRGTGGLTSAPPPGARILGEVPSAQAFLEQLGVLVFPLTAGSGVKVKVLEALATGVPVVTTAAGAEGVDGGDGIVVAEEDDALAAATARLLADEEERASRAVGGTAGVPRPLRPGPGHRAAARPSTNRCSGDRAAGSAPSTPTPAGSAERRSASGTSSRSCRSRAMRSPSSRPTRRSGHPSPRGGRTCRSRRCRPSGTRRICPRSWRTCVPCAACARSSCTSTCGRRTAASTACWPR